MRLSCCSSSLWPVVGAIAVLIPLPALAQSGASTPCPDQTRSDRPSHCEIRELVVPDVGHAVSVDVAPNGGVTVRGWERADLQIRSRIVATADTQQEADSLAGRVRVLAEGGRIRSEGPPALDDASWSVSVDLMVPREYGLNLTTVNGGISITDVRGRLEFRTTNGGVSLTDVGGDVRGRTTNGGVTVRLSGDGWHGQGLDVQTQNGGVRLHVPDGYSARLEAATTNGSVRCAIPVTVQGAISHRISAVLGQGGAPLTLATVNGGVTIDR